MQKFVDNTESDISCPQCNPPRKLIVKTNRNNENQFLGCPNYPECSHTREIPEAWKMRAAGQPGLFDGLAATQSGLYNCEVCGEEKCTSPGICDSCLAGPSEAEIQKWGEELKAIIDVRNRQKWLLSLPDGVPCDHVGCLSHVSHPCESCGRTAGRRTPITVESYYITHMKMRDRQEYEREYHGSWGEPGANMTDELFEDAKEWSRKQGFVTVSYLQRIMRIGYTRAARLVDLMVEDGFCGDRDPETSRREIIEPEHTGTPETCKHPECVESFRREKEE